MVFDVANKRFEEVRIILSQTRKVIGKASFTVE